MKFTDLIVVRLRSGMIALQAPPKEMTRRPLQWARIVSPKTIVQAGDPVADWFERCLDLYDGVGRSVTAA
jgi:hypothetical protein